MMLKIHDVEDLKSWRFVMLKT